MNKGNTHIPTLGRVIVIVIVIVWEVSEGGGGIGDGGRWVYEGEMEKDGGVMEGGWWGMGDGGGMEGEGDGKGWDLKKLKKFLKRKIKTSLPRVQLR